MRNSKPFVLLGACIILAGCTPKSSQERLNEFCIAQLDSQLGTWAKYGGWNAGGAKAQLFEMKPDAEANKKYDTSQFYNFDVIISDFTVKNGFNADVKSFASCTGRISKDSQGSFDPPNPLLVSLTVNGEDLGI